MTGMEVMEKHFGPVWFLPGKNRGRYPYCHSIFLPGPGILIDPASNRERLSALRTQERVRAVWLSHWHEDHFKDLDIFEDIPLYVSREDALPLSGIEHLLTGYDSASEFPYWKKVMEETFHFRPRVPASFLAGGQTIHFDGITVDIIATPGHTPGHLAFYFQEPQILFLGDYDLTSFGPWYGDYSSDIEETIKSLQHLQGLPAKLWITSHEQGIFEELPKERWQAYEDVIHKRDEKLLQVLTAPRSIEDIVQHRIVYGRPREPKEFFAACEKALLKKHLARLTKQGKLIERRGRYLRKEMSPLTTRFLAES